MWAIIFLLCLGSFWWQAWYFVSTRSDFVDRRGLLRSHTARWLFCCVCELLLVRVGIWGSREGSPFGLPKDTPFGLPNGIPFGLPKVFPLDSQRVILLGSQRLLPLTSQCVISLASQRRLPTIKKNLSTSLPLDQNLRRTHLREE